MKKFQTMMLMMLVAFMGMAVQSCGDDDDKVKVEVYYGYDLSGIKIIKGNEDTGTSLAGWMLCRRVSLERRNWS